MPRVAEHKNFIARFSGTNNVTPSTPHNKILIIYSQDVDLSGVSLGNILGVSLDLGMNEGTVKCKKVLVFILQFSCYLCGLCPSRGLGHCFGLSNLKAKNLNAISNLVIS